MVGETDPSERLERIEDWLFAILRFAITRHPADRTAIMARAADMDRPGGELTQKGFSYFVTTSGKVCDAIAGEERARVAVLYRYLHEIGNDRLRRALAAALNIERPVRTRVGKLGGQHSDGLWEGLNRQ
jgi:hypothetical protein